MKLYDELATDFSNSRAYPWNGWAKVKEYIEESQKKPFSVLDLGCGNGRFAEFRVGSISVDFPKVLDFREVKKSLLYQFSNHIASHRQTKHSRHIRDRTIV